MKRAAIVDHKLCNLDSIARAVEACGAASIKTDDPAALATADLLILPGVGHFGAAMDNLEALGLIEAIRAHARAGKPLLGVCLGMQLLGARSEEAGGLSGLGLIAGEVKRLAAGAGERVPHMGWNAVDFAPDDRLLTGVKPGADFYFVHSYHFIPAEAGAIVATTPYCGGFVSIVRRRNVIGVQFHPEKSQSAGFALLRNFIARGNEALAA